MQFFILNTAQIGDFGRYFLLTIASHTFYKIKLKNLIFYLPTYSCFILSFCFYPCILIQNS